MMNILLTTLVALCSTVPSDSLRTTDIEEVVIAATPKEQQRLRQQPLSFTAFSQNDMRERSIYGIKDLTSNVPNLFIPDYGSHLTTSVYVRGIGSRIGTPAVSLYVDGVPQISAASYDFNFSNIDRVDVLRGPQSTLYGRGAMGGVIRVFTKNPMQYQGTDITLDASHVVGSAPSGRSDGGGAGRQRLSLTHYHRINDRFAFTGHLFGTLDGGYFRNEARNNERMDDEKDLGARMRFIFKPQPTLNLDLTVGHEWLNQGGYPYEYLGTVGNATTPEPQTLIGHIAADNASGYKRNLTHAGLTVEKQWPSMILTSVTGFQHLHDRMDMDQDFTDRNLYTLIQRQNVNTLSEEVMLKNSDQSPDRIYQWLFGLAAIQQWCRIDGPVTFYQDGIDWLNGTINRPLPDLTAQGMGPMSVNLKNNILPMGGVFNTPIFNLGVFHQSNIKIVENLTLSAGLRFDYEHYRMKYDASNNIDFDFAIQSANPRNSIVLNDLLISPTFLGKSSTDTWQLLPKASLQYNFGDVGNVYASVSRGYRSGGYNVQMFSDLLQTEMSREMIEAIDVGAENYLNNLFANVPYVPAGHVDMIMGRIRDNMPSISTPDVEQTTLYKPETAWNYEIGTHLNLFEGRLKADLSTFWVETRNQQLSQMAASGLGRVTVNSGRSRSLGAEVAMQAQLTDQLSVDLAYGYTHARFRNGAEAGDAASNFVPFVPRNTFSVGATQHWTLPESCWLDGIGLHADYKGAGRIFWNEVNSDYQNFAGKLNARISLYKGRTEMAIYGSNLLSTRYQVFCFQTMQRSFAQYTRPMELGVQLSLHF